MGEVTGNVADRVRDRLDKLSDITSPQEAQTQVAILPLAAVHEARYAVQELKDTYQGTPERLIEMLEPINRVIGWVEASTYFLDVTTQREAIKTMFPGLIAAGSE